MIHHDSHKLYEAALALMSGIGMYAEDDLKYARDALRTDSGYEREETHIVHLGDRIIDAINCELEARQ